METSSSYIILGSNWLLRTLSVGIFLYRKLYTWVHNVVYSVESHLLVSLLHKVSFLLVIWLRVGQKQSLLSLQKHQTTLGASVLSLSFSYHAAWESIFSNSRRSTLFVCNARTRMDIYKIICCWRLIHNGWKFLRNCQQTILSCFLNWLLANAAGLSLIF